MITGLFRQCCRGIRADPGCEGSPSLTKVEGAPRLSFTQNPPVNHLLRIMEAVLKRHEFKVPGGSDQTAGSRTRQGALGAPTVNILRPNGRACVRCRVGEMPRPHGGGAKQESASVFLTRWSPFWQIPASYVRWLWTRGKPTVQNASVSWCEYAKQRRTSAPRPPIHRLDR